MKYRGYEIDSLQLTGSEFPIKLCRTTCSDHERFEIVRVLTATLSRLPTIAPAVEMCMSKSGKWEIEPGRYPNRANYHAG